MSENTKYGCPTHDYLGETPCPYHAPLSASPTPPEAARAFMAGEISAGKFAELLGLEPGEKHAFKNAVHAFCEAEDVSRQRDTLKAQLARLLEPVEIDGVNRCLVCGSRGRGIEEFLSRQLDALKAENAASEKKAAYWEGQWDEASMEAAVASDKLEAAERERDTLRDAVREWKAAEAKHLSLVRRFMNTGEPDAASERAMQDAGHVMEQAWAKLRSLVPDPEKE